MEMNQTRTEMKVTNKKRYFELWDVENKIRKMVSATYVKEHEWKANCCFHEETNPSLMINDDKKVYHCFGCGKKGQLFEDFIRDVPEEVLKGLEVKTPLSRSTPSSGDFVEGDNWKMRLNGQPTIEWLWDGIIPCRGINIILGKPKLGKSTFALNLADSITHGKPFLGREVKEGKVIYMVLEGESLIDQTVENWQLSNNLLWWRFPLEGSKKVEILKGWVKEHKPVAVFIDNLQRFLQIQKIESYSELSLALQPFEDIARIEGCSIILTHHSKKLEENIRDSFLGSTAGMGSVDTAILIQGHPPNAHPFDYRTFSTVQRCHLKGEDDLEGITLNMNMDYRLSLGMLVKEIEAEKDRATVLGTLANGPMTQAELYKAIPGPQGLVLRSLRYLEGKGLIRKVKGTGVRGDPITWGKA